MKGVLVHVATLALSFAGAFHSAEAAPGPLEAAEREERNSRKVFMPGEVTSRVMGSEGRKGMIDGVPYSYSIDGLGRPASGHLAGWSVRAMFDEMKGGEAYYLVNEAAKLMVFPGVKGAQPRFCVIGHNFPQRHAMARVDTGDSVTAQGDGCFTSSRLFIELASGGTVRTRRYEWPYDYSQDAVGDIANFGKAVRLWGYMRTTRFE